MKITVAEHAGACYGVERALAIVSRVLDEDGGAATLGSLIHNPAVVADLERRGAQVVENVEEVNGKTVVIRSHGATPQLKSELEARGVRIVDATCPHVAAAQKAAAALARETGCVLVVGESGHPEVEGLYAYAVLEGARACIVSRPEDIPAELNGEVGVVVQTTQTRAMLDAVVDELARRGIRPLVKNTICAATSQRQEAARKIAESMDVMVVIGGRNSSNTTRLAEICRDICPRTYHIEDAGELDPAWFEGAAEVGVTAGASTPDDQVEAVVAALGRIGGTSER